MMDFDYSSDALENKAAFYEKSFTVYVEGDEDVIFWGELFDHTGFKDAHVESVGGKDQLVNYINKIINENIRIVVACDSDYKMLDGNYLTHPKIIYTYGYSIENTMYKTDTINNIIQNLSKKRINNNEEIENWKAGFIQELTSLLEYDFANHLFGKGIKVLGDNCSQFLVSNSSYSLSSVKISNHIEKIKTSFKKTEIEKSKSLITKSNIDKWFLVKGHFLTNGVYNFIKRKSENISKVNVSFSLDSLYAMSVDCKNYQKHLDIQYIISKLVELKRNI